MPVLNTAANLLFGAEQVRRVMLRGVPVWLLPVPVNTVLPAITGVAVIDEELTCGTGTWTNSPTGYTYQWQEDDGGWADITGATSSTYTPTATGDVRCVVTATNSYGDSDPATSAPVTVEAGVLMVFGFNGVSDSGGAHANNQMYATRFTKTAAGPVTAAFTEFAGQDGWHLARARIVAMANDAFNSPGAVLWYSDEAIPATNGVLEFDLPSDVSGTDAAGTYWLGVAVYEVPGTTRLAAATGIDTVRVDGFNVATPPTTCPSPAASYENQAVRVWCEYIG